MKVLVTGGLGFIGSTLVDKLVENHDVYIIDEDRHGRIESWYNDKVKELFLDDIDDINEVTNIKYDVIYHLGAESRIQPSLINPEETFQTNVMGTVEVCRYAKKNNCKLIYAGSCTAEDQFSNPYAFTKFKGEETCRMYNEVYGMKTAIARFYNVYGDRHYREGDHATVLGVFEQQYIDGKPLTITGDGTQQRDFVHVDDIVDGLIKMSETECDGEIYNFGYGKPTSINDIAKMFNTQIRHIEKPYGEMYKVYANIYGAEHFLQWKPKIKVEDYIKEFTDVHRAK